MCAMHLNINTDELARPVVEDAWPDGVSFDSDVLSEYDTVLEIHAGSSPRLIG